MRIALTGASGFIGNALVPLLVDAGHTVMLGSNKTRLEQNARYKVCPLTIGANEQQFLDAISDFDVLVHLAWGKLDDFEAPAHLNELLVDNTNFISAAIKTGVKKLVVAGTCQEYGLQSGVIEEDAIPDPRTRYALAKDLLRRSILALQSENFDRFDLTWVRIFYPYGPGQKSGTLLGQLQAAIDSNSEYFNMSQGDQLRDFIHVSDLAVMFKIIIEDRYSPPIVNACSGNPTSVRDLARNYIQHSGSSIKLRLGVYPYPIYEPKHFWGKSKYLNSAGFEISRGI